MSVLRQLMKYININKPLTVIWLTFQQCLTGIISISMLFLGLVIAFAQFGYLVFGGATLSFLTLPMSM